MFLPAVCVNRMDHLTSYVQEVTDSTQKLCGLIRSTYMENFNSTWKTGECVCVITPPFHTLASISVVLLIQSCQPLTESVVSWSLVTITK